jgi:hypothetical protein
MRGYLKMFTTSASNDDPHRLAAPIHRTVDDIGRRGAVDAQRGNKRQRLPVTVGHARDEALTAWRTPIMPDHLRCDRGLVDKNEARRTQLGLLGFQRSALGSDVRPILLGGVQPATRRMNGVAQMEAGADFARHHGFAIAPCNVGRGNEKGRAESGVGYVKKNFLIGDHETFGTDGESTECEAEQILGHFLFL